VPNAVGKVAGGQVDDEPREPVGADNQAGRRDADAELIPHRRQERGQDVRPGGEREDRNAEQDRLPRDRGLGRVAAACGHQVAASTRSRLLCPPCQVVSLRQFLSSAGHRFEYRVG
jgi:hypothetical protein